MSQRLPSLKPREVLLGLAQTLLFSVCDLPKAPFAEGCEETPRPPPWSLREIAESKIRSLPQPSDSENGSRVDHLPFAAEPDAAVLLGGIVPNAVRHAKAFGR